MMQFKHQPLKETAKIKALEIEIQKLKKDIEEQKKSIELATDMIKKTADMLNDIALLQASHLEQTGKLHDELQCVLNALFPKDNIKYDLMNEPYN